uniref:Uncharacterized protein n=1 Tax=Haptolina brevifila TaxID=156173 RepID=A0A7S2NAC9_9EUKA|mmetsp:Transcript_71423/g.141611  ORF Transcript_71423/g.141611 Transcript_71423/m.141611 type:complete len:126 (+) Transcript_71423:113-490(+)
MHDPDLHSRVSASDERPKMVEIEDARAGAGRAAGDMYPCKRCDGLCDLLKEEGRVVSSALPAALLSVLLFLDCSIARTAVTAADKREVEEEVNDLDVDMLDWRRLCSSRWAICDFVNSLTATACC